MRRISDSERNRIKNEEGLGPKFKRFGRIVAYLCPQGVPTIGYGHTRSVERTDVNVREISKEQAESYLTADLAQSEGYVHKLNPNLNQNQFDALVSAAYNLGSFGDGLTNLIRTGQFAKVPAKLKQYIHASNGDEPCKGRCGVKTCKARTFGGLITRRDREAKLFAKPEPKGTKA